MASLGQPPLGEGGALYSWKSHIIPPGVLGSLYRHQAGVTGEEEETKVVKIQRKESF